MEFSREDAVQYLKNPEALNEKLLLGKRWEKSHEAATDVNVRTHVHTPLSTHYSCKENLAHLKRYNIVCQFLSQLAVLPKCNNKTKINKTAELHCCPVEKRCICQEICLCYCHCNTEKWDQQQVNYNQQHWNYNLILL